MKAIGKARLIISLTEGDAQYWRQIVRNVRVIPNPLSTNFIQDSPCYPSSNKRIIAVGRLTPQKRIDRLIDAFALLADKYPQWTVCIFGKGECQHELNQQIDRLRLSAKITIQPPTNQIIKEYKHSQFFVLSSDFEGFGLVIIEAMACGIPVVATNCPYGPSDIIEDSKTGLLAEMDVKDLAAKMEWMMSHDEERQEMGLRAHKATERYRMENIMPLWEQAYNTNKVK
jgi:glycosyltransferase involved in cell wall biosynthesis